HGRFAHVVGAAVAGHAVSRDARNHHDVAAGLLAHGGEDELREVVRAKGVCADDALHLGGVGIENGMAAAGDAGVVDEDVDVPEVFEHLFDHGLVVVPAIDGGGVAVRLAAGCFDGGNCLP